MIDHGNSVSPLKGRETRNCSPTNIVLCGGHNEVQLTAAQLSRGGEELM